MFSFRRKSTSKKGQDHNGPPFIRSSPSLPELNAQGIPWPENLVDFSLLPQTPPDTPPQGKPSPSLNGGPISSLYISHPPSAFENFKRAVHPRVRVTQRKSRNPTTFNIMVVGAQGAGKTSLLRLLLETADISPTATTEQKTAMSHFLRHGAKRTDTIQTACVEICESRYDRLLLSVIDTPGLDFEEGHELRLERQVTTVVKYLDSQFSDTLREESKVIRQSKGDQHVHLCIYMIDPASIVPASARHAQTFTHKKAQSEATISHPPDLSSVSDDTTSEESDDESSNTLTMSPSDIRVMRRLSTRVNLLPVIGHADSLTDDKLSAIKNVVRRDLAASGLDFGVFGPIKLDAPQSVHSSEGGEGDAPQNGHVSVSSDEAVAEDDVEERRARPVIKLRPSKHVAPRLSRSRSRLDVEPITPDTADTESIASVRFSAHIVARSDLSEILPFALIAPEHIHHRLPLKTLQVSAEASTPTASPSEDGHASSTVESAMTSPVSSASIRQYPYLAGPPADLRGVFVRKFRWGTIDVLSPEHCDFAALRTAVLSTHMKMLKVRTKEVLYEKFRTEKLLARRATRHIGEEQTRRLLEDLL